MDMICLSIPEIYSVGYRLGELVLYVMLLKA